MLHVVLYVHPQFVLRCQHFLSTLFTLKTTQLTHGIVHNFYVLCLLVLRVFLFFSAVLCALADVANDERNILGMKWHLILHLTSATAAPRPISIANHLNCPALYSFE